MNIQRLSHKFGGWRSLAVVIATALLLEMISGVQYYYARGLIKDELESIAQMELVGKARMMHYTLNSAEATLQEHLWDIKRHLDQPDSLFAATRRLIETNEKITGACLAFKPYYYPEKGRLFEPYAHQEGDSIVVEQLAERGHDYTTHPAYQKMLVENKAFWSDPYNYMTTDGPLSLTTYSYPIHDKNGDLIAICGIDLSLTWLGDTLNARHLYPSTFDLFLTESGELIAGPNMDSVSIDHVNRVVSIINDSTIPRQQTANKRCTAITFKDGKDVAYVYYGNLIGDTHWKVAMVCYDDEVFAALRSVRQHTFLMMLAGFILLGFIVYRYIFSIVQLRQAEIDQRRINDELHIAKDIQMQMLPEQFPPYPEHPGLDIYGSLTPAREVGGDLFDFFLRDQKLLFCIGDVSGKGIPAAMVMARTQTLFRIAAAHTNDTGHILHTINEVLCQGNESNMFVTCFIGILDLTTGHLDYCDAGHDCPLLNGSPLPAKPHLPLGLFNHIDYQQQEMTVPSGAVLFLYTDGLTEAKNRQNKLFGLDRVIATLSGDDSNCQMLIQHMYDAVELFVDGAEQSDDLTMLAIRNTIQS